MIIKDKERSVKIGDKTYHCVVDVAMGFVGGKWKAVVLWYLKGGTKRYSDLKRLMPDITEKMLAKQLRELQNDGLVTRKDYGVVPPRVEYSLSDEGRALVPLLEELAKWGRTKANNSGIWVDAEPRMNKPRRTA